jgi:hypothetical protein
MINTCPIYQYRFYQALSNTLMVGTESVSETLENFHTLTQLSAREEFIENWYVFKNFIKLGK